MSTSFASTRPRVFLIGFSRFERESLEAYFRLATTGPAGGWMVVLTLAEADVAIADADQEQALYTVGRAGRVPDTLFIGAASVPPSAGARLPRPVDVLQVQRTLDHLRERRERRLRPTACAASHAGTRGALPSQWPQLAAPGAHTRDLRGSAGKPILTQGDASLDDVLVVSASPAERRLWHDLLGRYGYGVSLAMDTQQALTMAEEHTYSFVFLGLGQDGQEGYPACRRIPRRLTDTGVAPVVVAIAQRSGAIGRIRATFAGCDAYLTAPLNEDELLRLLAQHDRAFERVFEPTAPLPA